MGLSVSKRVKSSLSNSPEFDSACDSAFSHCLFLTQQAFPGVFPYQLTDASDHLFSTLTAAGDGPRALKWLSSPPTRSQVDSALRVVTRRPENKDEAQTLDWAHFREWAVELYSDAVVSNARGAMLRRVPIGAAGIFGIGTATRLGNDLVGAAIGVYALGVSAAVYFSLQGK
ncbi:hypothetical protein TIFTF001_005872 [Ficus carica]|uniref:Uncharacterized protein n=1 Tax=Ficus carica TaxID=3494 RepID=A0AA87ZPU1_FICCA|nr:hypothetical protein TIFTF001_005872 [Ficus carica]